MLLCSVARSFVPTQTSRKSHQYILVCTCAEKWLTSIDKDVCANANTPAEDKAKGALSKNLNMMTSNDAFNKQISFYGFDKNLLCTGKVLLHWGPYNGHGRPQKIFQSAAKPPTL